MILECTSAAAHVHTMPGETASAHMPAPPVSSQGGEVRVRQTQGKKGKYAATAAALACWPVRSWAVPWGLTPRPLCCLGHADNRDALLAKLRECDAQVAMTSLDTEKKIIARLEAR